MRGAPRGAGILAAFLFATATIAPGDALGQTRCKTGKPCGDTCIPLNAICPIGSAGAGDTAASVVAAIPEGARYAASSRGHVYYWIGCAAWRRLAPGNLVFFNSAVRAEAAGYRPSRSAGCGRRRPEGAADSMAIGTPVAPGAAASRATAAAVPSGASPHRATPAALATPPAPPRFGGVCVIARVVDGDTLACRNGERIRLLLIDAPEMDQGPFGHIATWALQDLAAAGDSVDLEFDVERRDRYGRILAYAYLPDGRMVNEALVRQGYAVMLVYPPNVKHVERMRAAAVAARVAAEGLWATPAFSCAPVDHRAGRCE
ncbi:MAG TPA: thermonuclease family protein [Longimicrobiales bacterium]